MPSKLVNFTAGSRKSSMGGILVPSGADLSWIQGMGGKGDIEVPSGTINGTNDTFTLTRAPNSIVLRKNGGTLVSGNDYTLSGSTITYLSGAIPVSGDYHEAELF